MDSLDLSALHSGGGIWRSSRLIVLVMLFLACATPSKPSLEERLTAMSDADLLAYYQGIDYRLKAVGDEVRRETAEKEGAQTSILAHQTYFLGGEGHRLMRQREVAEKELLRRNIPRSVWASGPD